MPLEEIQALFKLKPLQRYVPSHDQFNDDTLKAICKALLTASPEEVKETIMELQSIHEQEFHGHSYIPGMLGRVSKQYSEFDNGNLVAVLLMNYMVLEPGESICVPANGLHAYLEGDIVECMARSDNMLATGFCPRADRDNVDVFVQALQTRPHSADEAKLRVKPSAKGEHGKTLEYAPPIKEFNVLATSLGAGEQETHKAIGGPSLMIVTEGGGKVEVSGKTTDLDEGSVFFIGQGVTLNFGTERRLVVYRAYVE